MTKEIFLNKLDLLNISLEAIILHCKDKNSIDKFYKLRNDLRIKKYSKEQNFTFLLEYIYNIKQFIAHNYIDIIALKVIQNYINKPNNKTIRQYISKFHYVYFRNKQYYGNCKSLKSNKIEKIAIINLYLIAKLKNLEGSYTLIRYLNKN
uniref:Uncharacterized protein n=1 Tax=Vertebrata australis TaxID=1967852 RepID=A0A1Z1MII4_9FLOR|nr:hypothetical protein [Vertebrata australis]ARW65887.1 hypothetical protein [Vertebrata australis]